jgi:23S rRNA pseudouridine2605 synthase
MRARKRPPASLPLPRALSKLGLASRKQALDLIRAGRVRVGGRVVTNPDTRVKLDATRLSVEGIADKPRGTTRVVVLNKPRGTVTTRRDPEGRRTVFDVLGEAGTGLVAVGRLDLASTGLLLFTNDTQLANRLTDPANRIERRYVVTVRGRVEPEAATRLSNGDTVRVAIRKASNRETHLLVTLTEGKNREIRKMFESIDREVTRLHRIAFGQFGLGDLQPGQWRELDARPEGT